MLKLQSVLAAVPFCVDTACFPFYIDPVTMHPTEKALSVVNDCDFIDRHLKLEGGSVIVRTLTPASLAPQQEFAACPSYSISITL